MANFDTDQQAKDRKTEKEATEDLKKKRHIEIEVEVPRVKKSGQKKISKKVRLTKI